MPRKADNHDPYPPDLVAQSTFTSRTGQTFNAMPANRKSSSRKADSDNNKNGYGDDYWDNKKEPQQQQHSSPTANNTPPTWYEAKRPGVSGNSTYSNTQPSPAAMRDYTYKQHQHANASPTAAFTDTGRHWGAMDDTKTPSSNNAQHTTKSPYYLIPPPAPTMLSSVAHSPACACIRLRSA